MSFLSFLIVSGFLRYNLYLSTAQLSREFLTQNAKEIYSIDTLRISSRLNSFSKSLNWVCIEAEVNQKPFFKMSRGECTTGLFQQRSEIFIVEANNLKISFTLKPAFELELLFIGFLIVQIALFTSLILATKRSELEKRQQELKWLKLSRKMFHDIRSPLASLNSISEDLHFETAANKTLFAHSITRINDIANSLLSTTQNQVIKLPEFGDINVITMEILEEKKLEHMEAIFDFIEISKSTSALFVTSEIKRIFSNLINNAIESSNAKSKIKIEISHNDSFTFIDIFDNGAGIPDSVLEKLGVEEITSKKSGNGIGFKDAKETLVEWGGNLEIIKTSQEGTHIRLSLKSKLEPKTYYLIDDDALVRLTWEARAKKANITLSTFKSTTDFESEKNNIDKNANIFIDSELGVVKGEDFAKQLNLEGFKNISITSGHDSSNFENLHFLKSVISKTPPF